MSDFDDSMAEALGECLEEIGTTEFQIGDRTFQGDPDELGNRSYQIIDGGKEITVVSHVLCALAQFEGNVPQDGRLKIGEQLFTIAAVSQDKASVTFTLADPDAG
jgi:hypothetical protein